MILDHRRLRLVREIGRTGSLTGASAALRIAQPALSAQLKEIETHFGTALFLRHARGMKPTMAGRVLMEHAERIIAATEQAEADLFRRSTQASGRVRLGLPFSIAALCLGDVLTDLQKEHPQISLVFTEGFSGTLAERVGEGSVDLAVLVGESNDPRIANHPIARERMSLIVPASDPLSARDQVPLEEVVGLPLILPTRVHGVRRLIDGHAVANGWSLNIRHEVDSAFQLVDLVHRGFGLTVLTPSSIGFGQASDELCPIPIVQPGVWRHLTLAWPADRPPDHITKVVGQILLSAIARRLRAHGDAVEWTDHSLDIQ